MDAGFLIIKSFSVVHKLQALDPGLYDWHLVKIFQFMVYLVPSLFNFQISFESSVDVSCFWCLELLQWLYHRFLKLCSVRPMYERILPSSSSTSAW